MVYRDQPAFSDIELCECLFGEPQFPRLDNGGIIDHVKNGEHLGAIGADQDFGKRLKAFCPVNTAFTI
jgi:hypothetical protein